MRLSFAAAITLLLCAARFPTESRRVWYVATDCAPRTTLWYACFYGGDLEFTTSFYGMKYLGNTKNLIDNTVLKLGAYERPALYFLRDVMMAVHSNRAVFLDLGANVGEYSLFMSRYSKEVHAFDPYPPALDRLRRHIEVNSIKNIIVHPVGVGNKNESIPLLSKIIF